MKEIITALAVLAILTTLLVIPVIATAKEVLHGELSDPE